MYEEEKRIPVAVRAVVGRINRRIKRHGQRLVVCRNAQHRAEVGQYFLVSIETGRLVERGVDLERLARGVFALELWEEIQPKEVSDERKPA